MPVSYFRAQPRGRGSPAQGRPSHSNQALTGVNAPHHSRGCRGSEDGENTQLQEGR